MEGVGAGQREGDDAVDVSDMEGRLYFRTENYLQVKTSTTEDLERMKDRFDVVLCLSTIKWVQLALGDVGLMALFMKAYE